MTTLMRNGRDRRSENPILGHAQKERVSLFGTDQRITSGPAARTAAIRGRIHDCTRIVSRKGQILFPCTAGAAVVCRFKLVQCKLSHRVAFRGSQIPVLIGLSSKSSAWGLGNATTR